MRVRLVPPVRNPQTERTGEVVVVEFAVVVEVVTASCWIEVYRIAARATSHEDAVDFPLEITGNEHVAERDFLAQCVRIAVLFAHLDVSAPSAAVHADGAVARVDAVWADYADVAVRRLDARESGSPVTRNGNR